MKLEEILRGIKRVTAIGEKPDREEVEKQTKFIMLLMALLGLIGLIMAVAVKTLTSFNF